MAINLITGLPGNAKTLHTIGLVVDLAAAENRPVYYSGLKQFIPDHPRLKGTSWIEFDPTKWHEEVPSGAICFIDECQKIFRSRSLGAQAPKYVTELEEHRHKGLDFFMVTQHPSLIDPAIRKLTQTHRHLVRVWGMEATTVHRWDSVRETCDKPTSRKDSEKQKWIFDKTLYGVYHSADVHTVKRRIPGRVKLLAAIPFVLVGLVYFAYSRMHHMSEARIKAISGKSASQAAPGGSQVAPGVVMAAGGQAGGGGRELPLAVTDPVMDAKAYLVMQTPRIQGLPQTAPKYDELTRPSRVPIPAMCVQVGALENGRGHVRCKCWTQQGTPMDVPFGMCLEFARNGFFHDFDADRDRDQALRASVSERVMSNRPDSPVVGRDQSGPEGPSGLIPGKPMGPQAGDTSPPMSAAYPDGTVMDGPPNNRATRAASSAAAGGA